MYQNSLKNREKILAVAPMMDWTDRHCRFFHRLLTQKALLYSEMVVADAVIYGERDKLLGQKVVGPTALQLGGSDPVKLAEAAKIGQQYGYDEINLNVGCPSDRVQSGTFGACLMKEPDLVARCVEAMKLSVSVPVTVKCRIGVDEQEPSFALPDLAQKVWNAGCDGLWVHARKAWLDGLSPKENRTIPPLDYGIVRDLKLKNTSKFIGLNGGLENLNQALEALNLAGDEKQLDGAMFGRSAYHTPRILLEVDQMFYGESNPVADIDDVLKQIAEYADRHIKSGGRLHHITRHMMGLFHGKAGGKKYRQVLSTLGTSYDATSQVLFQASNEISI